MARTSACTFGENRIRFTPISLAGSLSNVVHRQTAFRHDGLKVDTLGISVKPIPGGGDREPLFLGQWLLYAIRANHYLQKSSDGGELTGVELIQ